LARLGFARAPVRFDVEGRLQAQSSEYPLGIVSAFAVVRAESEFERFIALWQRSKQPET
jgi:hypothetical protein